MGFRHGTSEVFRSGLSLHSLVWNFGLSSVQFFDGNDLICSLFDQSWTAQLCSAPIKSTLGEKGSINITGAGSLEQALPRTLWLDGSTTKSLLQWPVAEVDALRGAKSTSGNILLEPAKVVKVKGGDGPQVLCT